MNEPQVCANCGEPYVHHMQTTQCYPDSKDRWFPKSIADALTKQRKRIRRAQISLAKEHAKKTGSK